MDVREIMPAGKLTAAQLDILKLFSREIPDENRKEIRQLIATYFAEKATAEMDKLFAEKGGGLKSWKSGARSTCERPKKNGGCQPQSGAKI